VLVWGQEGETTSHQWHEHDEEEGGVRRCWYGVKGVCNLVLPMNGVTFRLYSVTLVSSHDIVCNFGRRIVATPALPSRHAERLHASTLYVGALIEFVLQRPHRLDTYRG
jgi:hypothetical protein